MVNLTGKVAIVTGGGGGLGHASAVALAAKGAAVAVVDINASSAQKTVDAITEQGGNAISLAADLGNEIDIASVIAETIASWGRVDIVHNNAAEMNPDILRADQTVLELDPAIFSRVFSVNVIGYALMAKHSIPHMVRQGGGVIINTASVTGYSAELGRVMYGTTKSAIHGLTRNIATQHGKTGIRCVSISPGVIITPSIRQHMSEQEIDEFTEHNALGCSGQAEDIGSIVSYLACDEARFITGTDIVIDGGLLSHFPTVVDERRRQSAK